MYLINNYSTLIFFYSVQEDNVNQAQSGLIFDGNKFACEPTLPFNAMAMPSFDKLAGKWTQK